MKTVLTLLLCACLSTSCTVLTVAGVAAGAAVSVVSTGVDVAVSTAKVGAKVVGAAAEAALPDAPESKK